MGNQNIPAFPDWSEFNSVTDVEDSTATRIGYGSIFPSPPTSRDVIETSLDYVIGVSQKLANEFAIHTCESITQYNCFTGSDDNLMVIYNNKLQKYIV